MGISVEWGNEEKTFVLQDYTPGWKWEDFYESSSQTVKMIKQVDHIAHIVSDFRNSGALPVGSSITHARNVMKNYPANWGILVVVTDSMFIRSLVGAFRRLFASGIGGKTYASETIEEAHELMAAYVAQQ